MVCHTAHSRLGVTVCSRRVAVYVTEVTVSLNESVTEREILRHSYHRAVYGRVAVRMVSTKHVTDCGRGFSEGLIVGKIILVHSVENTSLSRLHTVSYVGKRTGGYNAHRILYEGGSYLLFHISFLYSL